MEVTVEKARELFKSPPTSRGSGSDCRFYKLTDTLGIKVYRDRDFAVMAHEGQSAAYAVGLAPECGPLIEDEEMHIYFFTTEIVEVAFDRGMRLAREAGHANTSSYIRDYYRDDEYELGLKLVENGFDTAYNDLHSGNWGYLPDGRAVCIDFAF